MNAKMEVAPEYLFLAVFFSTHPFLMKISVSEIEFKEISLVFSVI